MNCRCGNTYFTPEKTYCPECQTYYGDPLSFDPVERDAVIKSLAFLINQNLATLLFCNSRYGGVYIACIDMVNTDGYMSLEVEVNEGTIAFSFPVSEENLGMAQSVLGELLTLNGIGFYLYYAYFEAKLNEKS